MPFCIVPSYIQMYRIMAKQAKMSEYYVIKHSSSNPFQSLIKAFFFFSGIIRRFRLCFNPKRYLHSTGLGALAMWRSRCQELDYDGLNASTGTSIMFRSMHYIGI